MTLLIITAILNLYQFWLKDKQVNYHHLKIVNIVYGIYSILCKVVDELYAKILKEENASKYTEGVY